ncbi:MAG: ATP-binding protein, partial [Patescibacteria group bacterium]|nr:ATP-binding protein [Patescibacteria group bacterium]
MIYAIFLLILLIIILTTFYIAFRIIKKNKIKNSLESDLFLIEVPIKTFKKEGEQKDFKTEINLTEQLLSNLSFIKEPFTFEIAVPHIGEEIHFYISIPKKYSEITEKQIQGLWPGAILTRIYDDYTIFNPNGVVSGAYFLLNKNFSLPIRTYQEIGLDTLNSIIGGFSKISEIGEGAAIQLIIKPADKKFKKNIINNLKYLKQGENPEKILESNKIFDIKFSDFNKAINPKSSEEKESKEKIIIDEDAVKALEIKLSKPLFEINLRILTSAPTKFTADDILNGLLSGFNQFAAPRRNEFKIIKPKKLNKLIYDFTFRNFDESKTMILSSEEIASFFHLPISSTETPKVKLLKSKQAPPPPNLPTEGTLIGQTNFRGEKKPVYITNEDRMRHIYIIGQTGTGKSTLLGDMFLEDIRAGKGIAVIDPHGDLVENALSFVPKERIDDVIYFDPGDLERPLGLNMLEYNFSKPEEKTFIVNEFINIFDKLYDLKQ